MAMLPNIQNRLLLRHPLIWNTRIIPLSIVLIFLNALFFAGGFAAGALDFTYAGYTYNYIGSNELSVFIGCIVGFLCLVMWLVFYFKNNAFKAFYPQERFSLFREWLLILTGCFLICMMPVSFMFAKDFRARCYFSEEEATRRAEVISKAALFYAGGFRDRSYHVHDSVNGKNSIVSPTHFAYKGRSYSVGSLMNKTVEEFSFPEKLVDSTAREEVYQMLYHDRKASVRKLLRDYLEIAAEHHLKASVTADEWFDMVYHSPEFTDFETIHTVRRYPYNANFSDSEEYVEDWEYTTADTTFVYADAVSVGETASGTPAIDSLTQEVRKEGDDLWVYNKYYVQAKPLEQNYEAIMRSYRNRYDVFGWMCIAFYVAAAFSAFIFSFRVTSGRSWLIAGILSVTLLICGGIIGAFSGDSLVWLTTVFLTLAAILLYFFFVPKTAGEKKWSGIALNMVLWMVVALLPFLYGFFLEIVMEASGYNDASYESRLRDFPTLYEMGKDHTYFLVFQWNIVMIIVMMALMSPVIRRWKGIPED